MLQCQHEQMLSGVYIFLKILIISEKFRDSNFTFEISTTGSAIAYAVRALFGHPVNEMTIIDRTVLKNTQKQQQNKRIENQRGNRPKIYWATDVTRGKHFYGFGPNTSK